VNQLSKIVNKFLVYYFYWISFEWLFLSRFNSYLIIQLIRNFIDIIPLVFAIVLFLVNSKMFKSIELKIFTSFFIILLLTCFSLYYEIHTILPIISYIGVTLRFLPLLFLIKYTCVDFPKTFIKNAKIIYWIHIVLSLFCLINKEIYIQIFLPAADVFGTEKPTIFDDAGITSVFINTIEFSFFILSLTIIYLGTCKRNFELFYVVLFSSFVIIFSYSIASIICLILVLFFSINKRYRLLFTAFFIIIGSFIFLFNFEIIQILLGMDIQTWIDISSEYNRVGYFTKLLPEFLSGNLKDLIFGFGYDGQLIGQKLYNYVNAPFTMINNENNLKYLKDVYWISILFAQGIIVLLINFYILIIIFIRNNRNKLAPFYFIIKTFIFIIFFVGFFNQILDIKAFTFCFWLFVALQINQYKFTQVH